MFKNGVFPVLISIVILASGCGGYEKLLKSDDFESKQVKAKEYYNEGDYAKALPLLDQLLVVKSGTTDEEEIRYYIAYSHYGQSEFLLASSLFKGFWLAFPRSYRAEEALYMSAYSLFKASPHFELDQSETEKALDAFQFFIDTYDGSERINECNKLMDELRFKLEEKIYESANMYYRMEQYQAAAITYENMLQEFPETEEAENIGLLIVRSYYNYAVQSVICKRAERCDKAIASYAAFIDRYPISENKKEAESIYSRIIALKNKALVEQENYNCNE
ncbi:MAG: outer membrane protein assembly factor BamD [Chitinophagales bacterium]